MKLIYTGDHERDFPGVGTFTPGKVIEVNQEIAETLLLSGYFAEQIAIEERPDNAEPGVQISGFTLSEKLEPSIEKTRKGSVK